MLLLLYRISQQLRKLASDPSPLTDGIPPSELEMKEGRRRRRKKKKLVWHCTAGMTGRTHVIWRMTHTHTHILAAI